MENHLLIISVFVILGSITTFFAYRNKKSKRLITSQFQNNFETSADVTYSKLHQLFNVKLQIYFDETDILLTGFDYYRHKKRHFIFTTKSSILNESHQSISVNPIINISTSGQRTIEIIGTKDSYEVIIKIVDKKCFTEFHQNELLHKHIVQI